MNKYKIVHKPEKSSFQYVLYVQRKFLGIIPYWKYLDSYTNRESIKPDLPHSKEKEPDEVFVR